jgi:HKD family nuclease
LTRHLTPHIGEAGRVDIAISFVMESGVRLPQPHVQDLLDRGGVLRLITGDYLDVTDPEALRGLMDLEGRTEFKVFEAGVSGFIPSSESSTSPTARARPLPADASPSPCESPQETPQP